MSQRSLHIEKTIAGIIVKVYIFQKLLSWETQIWCLFGHGILQEKNMIAQSQTIFQNKIGIWLALTLLPLNSLLENVYFSFGIVYFYKYLISKRNWCISKCYNCDKFVPRTWHQFKTYGLIYMCKKLHLKHVYYCI